MRIQCNINGYNGNPVTMLFFFKENILTLVKVAKFSEQVIAEDMALVGNIGEDLDFEFTDNDFQDAIMAYFEKSNKSEIAMDESLARYKPNNRIEVDKIDENGKKYRVSSDIDNGQIAVLTASLFAKKQQGFIATQDFMQELERIQNNNQDDDLYKIIII